MMAEHGGAPASEPDFSAASSCDFQAPAGDVRFLQSLRPSLRYRLAVGLRTMGIGLAAAFLAAAFPMLGVLLVLVAATVYVEWRRKRQQTLLGVIAAGARGNVPLVSLLLTFAKEYGGLGFRYRILRLCTLLRHGAPLPAALDATRLVPQAAMGPLWVGYETGTLGDALQGLHETRRAAAVARISVMGVLLYLVAVAVVAIGTVLLLQMRIFSELAMIMDEWDVRLTGVAAVIWDVLLVSGGEATAMAVISLFLLLTASFVVLVGYFGWIEAVVPPAASICRDAHTAEVLSLLSIYTARSRPIEEGLRCLEMHYRPAWMGRRIGKALRLTAGGVPWEDSLRQAGILSQHEVAVLASAERTGTQQATIEGIARSRRCRFERRALWWGRLAVSAGILVAAVFTAMVALSVFLPYIEIIVPSDGGSV